MSKKLLHISTAKLTAACCGLLLVVFCMIGMSFRPVYDENEAEEIVMSGQKRSHWHWVESGCVSDTHHYKSSKDYAQTQVQTMGNGIATISTEETTNVTSPASGSPRVTSTTAVAGNTASISWNSGLEHGDQETGYDAGTIAAAHKKTFTLTATPADPDEYYFAGWGTSTSESSINNNDNPRVIISDMEISGYTDTSGDNQPANYATNTYTEKYYAFFKARVPVDITLMPDPNGSISYSYKNVPTTTVSGETTFNTKYDVTLIATPNEGYVFFGWYTLSGSTENYISYANPNTRAYKENITIYAKFIPANQATFNIKGTEQYYYDLGRACSEAASSSSKIVYPIKDGFVPAGNYTIPSGVTLVIPYNSAVNSQTIPALVKSESMLYAYRKLTLVDGVNITVNGDICVGGQQTCMTGGKPSGYATGACGVLDMSSGGHIELNSGSNLYAWGFVKGQDMDQGNNTVGVGTITANNGANVWEDFAVGDWRGGNACLDIQGSNFFPFQSYFIQNIEVPLTVKYGAVDNCYASVSGGGEYLQLPATMIGTTDALFKLSSGSVVRKWYDATTDLMCFELSGTANLDAVVVKGLPVIGNISSKDYYLPISSNMHIILTKSSVEISKPMVLQPGAKVEIKSDATITISSNVFIYDQTEWGPYAGPSYYFHNYGKTYGILTIHKNRGDGTSKDLLDDAQFIVDGQLNITGKLYTTASGADIMGNGGGRVQFSAIPTSSSSIDAFTGNGDKVSGGVAANAANLHNEDASYTKSIASTTFHNVHGRWFTAAAKDEKANHTYDFTYISSGAVSGSGGTNTTTDAVYSNDKTGLEARMKWFNVTADCNAGGHYWWHGQGEQAGWFYNWTLNSAWHQFMPTATTDLYSGSNNTLYTKTSCTWEELGSTDVNCLYEIVGVKKALVEGEFIALEPNNNDPAYHAADDASQYYICFEGCNWHAADKYTEEEKAYIIAPDTFIWYDNAWMSVNFKQPFAYTLDETNVPVYYEYLNGEWVLAEPYVRVVDGLEDRTFWFFEDAFKFANSALRTSPTITILRDISGITTALSYTGANKTCTLDLNGHIVSGAVPYVDKNNIGGLLVINASGSTFTITDKSGEKNGRIENSFAQNTRTYGVNLTNGTLVLEDGIIFAENTLAYNSSSAKSTAVSAVYVAAGQTFTMNAGSAHAKGCYAARGVDVAGSTSANATVNINAGTVTAETTQASTAYGIYAVGGTTKVKSGATINAIATTTTAYGICIDASTKKYFGSLEMAGGTVNVESRYTSTSKDAVAAAVYVGGTYIMANTTPNTISVPYRAVANISGGTFNVVTTTARAAYGVRTRGTTTITGGTFNVMPKTTMAYGIWAEDGIVEVSSSATFTVKATATAYGIYANGVTPDDKTGRPYNPVVTVKGGTFNVQTTSKTTAYGVFVNGNTRPVISTASGYYAGNYSSAGNVTVNGGIFNVTAKTTVAYGAYVAAPKEEAGATSYDPVTANPKCTINGGYFKLTGTSDVNAVNNLATTDNLKVQGGYYSHNGYLEDYKVLPKQVLTLVPSDPNRPDYEYKVADAYLITFRTEDGMGEDLQLSYQEAGVAPVYSEAEPTKSNSETQSFVFDGWATEANGAKIYNPNELPNVSADATYYAHFNPTTLKYRVHLDATTNGGLCETENIYIAPGTAVGTLPNATKVGHTFNGWFSTSAATGGTQLAASTVINADAEYFARFTVNSNTLTWHLDGGKVTTAGTAAAKNATGSPNGSVNYGTDIAIPVVAKTGYTFIAWSPNPAITMPDGDVTYTALWTPKTNTAYTVKHYLQNVDGTYPADPVETQSLTGTTASSVTPDVKSYDGFVSPAAQTVTIAADGSLVVEYQYARRHYTFTLDAATNGGTSEVPSIEVIHGATIGAVPPDAQKGCNDFTGWYTKAAGGVKITSAFVIEYDMKTLYAQFSDDVRTYPIIYDAGAHGTGTVAAGTKTCGEDATLSSSTFTRTGYTQTGWSTTDGGTKTYDLGDIYTENGSVTLYPFWTINTRTLTWDWGGGETSSADYTAAGSVVYGTALVYPADNTMTKANYVFSGWSTNAATMPDEDLTITAQWTPAVASVTVSGATTYYTTLQAAFNYAADKTEPTITVLDDINLAATKVTYTNTSKTTVKFDLNGHTVSGAANQLLYLTSGSSTGGTFVIKSSVAGGQIRNVLSSTSSRSCVYLYKGKLKLESGTIYNENTNTGGSYAVLVASSRTFTMTGGKLESKAPKSAYGLFNYGTSTISGGNITATENSDGTASSVYAYTGTTTLKGTLVCDITGTTGVYGAFVGGATPASDKGTTYNGTLVIEGGTFNVTANSSGTAYGVYCTGNTRKIDYSTSATYAGNYADAGTATIKGGVFTVEGKTTYGVGTKAAVSINTAKDADGNATYATASATPKTTITGGKFHLKGTTTKAVVTTTATNTNQLVQGGWYNVNTNLSGYVAPTKSCNYWELPLTGEEPYLYEVAEAYNVTFNANGHGTAPDAQLIKKNGTVTEPDALSETGYTFGGWYKEAGCTNAWNFSTDKVTATTTLYAKWTVIQYTISFDSNGGSEVASITQDYNTAVTAPANPTKTGYSFAGWDPAVPNPMPAENTECVAQWTPNTNTPYVVKHYQQNLDGTYPEEPTDTDNETGTTDTEVTPAVKNYTGFTAPDAQTVTVSADGSRVVTYQYTRNSYNLTWNSNGGELSGSYTSGLVLFGTTITAPTANRANYDFDGWDEEPAATMPAEDKTYTAQWSLSAVTILWKSEDGSETLETDNLVLIGAAPSFDGTAPTKATTAEYTYTFDGWTTEANGSGTFYAIGELPVVSAAATYYAHFTATANVASVKVGSTTTYYTTLQEAISYAATQTNPTVTVLQDISGIATAIIYETHLTASTCTLDLKGHTISGTVTNLLYIYPKTAAGKDNNKGTFVIKSTAGNALLKTEAAYNGSLYALNVYNGTVKVSDVTIEAINTKAYNSSSAKNVACAAVYVRASRKFSMTSGMLKATGKYKVYGISTAGTTDISGTSSIVVNEDKSGTAYGVSVWSGTTTIKGGNISVTGVKNVYGVAVGGNTPSTSGTEYNGTVKIQGGSYTVHATSNTAYGVYAYCNIRAVNNKGNKTSAGIANISGGEFSVISDGATAAGIFVQAPKTVNTAKNTTTGDLYPERTATPQANVTGGKFNVSGASSVGAVNTTATNTNLVVEGGWYNDSTNLGKYTAPEKDCDYFTLETTEEDKATVGSDYNYKVVEIIDIGDRLDIIDWTTTTLTINANGWAASGWPYTINGMPYEKEARAADRTLTIPYSAEAGTDLRIRVQSGGSLTSQHYYTVPFIGTTSGTNASSIVYVNEGTLTISSNTTLAALYIRPEASVEVTSGTLTVGKLVMRTLPWQTASISGNFTATETWYTRIAPNKRTITGPYAPITYESASYYQFALPRNCTAALKDIQVSNAANTPYGNTWLLKRYNEATRAEKGIGEANWVALGNEEYIQGGVGYEMFSNSNYYREFYFPLGEVTSASLGNTTAVRYDIGAAGEKHAGWNWVASPLMSVYDNSEADPETGLKIGILMTDGSYDQGVPDYIYPAIPFSYQTSAGQSSISFAGSSIVAAAPQRRAAADESVRKQWLHLDIKNDAGVGDQTSVLTHPTRYEETYKTGIDVAKQSFEASRALIYSTHTYGEMAFAGVSDALLKRGVALTVYSPSAQNLTISMRDNNWLERMRYVWLIDHETGAYTDLLWEPYTFEAVPGTTANRFTIQGVFRTPQVTTDVENGVNGENGARKVIINDKMYIILNGRMYDATGKIVK